MEEQKITKTELLQMLDEMVESYSHVPPGGMLTPINHYDFVSLLILLKAIFRNV